MQSSRREHTEAPFALSAKQSKGIHGSTARFTRAHHERFFSKQQKRPIKSAFLLLPPPLRGRVGEGVKLITCFYVHPVNAGEYVPLYQPDFQCNNQIRTKPNLPLISLSSSSSTFSYSSKLLDFCPIYKDCIGRI